MDVKTFIFLKDIYYKHIAFKTTISDIIIYSLGIVIDKSSIYIIEDEK